MRYLHLIDAADGSRFADDGEIAFVDGDFAPPGPPMGIATDTGVANLSFIRMEAGWTDAAHPAPARQWMFVMSGRGESTAGGETRPVGTRRRGAARGHLPARARHHRARGRRPGRRALLRTPPAARPATTSHVVDSGRCVPTSPPPPPSGWPSSAPPSTDPPPPPATPPPTTPSPGRCSATVTTPAAPATPSRPPTEASAASSPGAPPSSTPPCNAPSPPASPRS